MEECFWSNFGASNFSLFYDPPTSRGTAKVLSNPVLPAHIWNIHLLYLFKYIILYWISLSFTYLPRLTHFPQKMLHSWRSRTVILAITTTSVNNQIFTNCQALYYRLYIYYFMQHSWQLHYAISQMRKLRLEEDKGFTWGISKTTSCHPLSILHFLSCNTTQILFWAAVQLLHNCFFHLFQS